MLLFVAALAAACGERAGDSIGCPACDDGGTGDDGGAQPTGCPGDQPALEECFVGDFFAECGGTGEDRLACSDTDDCRWFTGGCIAQGYEASDCPAASICCHEHGSGTYVQRWPFAGERYCPDLAEISEPFESLWFYGALPWNRVRGMVLPTTTSAELQPASFTCFRDAVDYAITWCDGGQYQWMPRGRLGETLVIDVWPGTSAFSLWIEVDLAAPAGPVARACISAFQDAVQCGCPQGTAYPICAESGSLVLSGRPTTADELSGLRFEIDATLSNGAVLSGGLTLP